jgi:hypothetical protein
MNRFRMFVDRAGGRVAQCELRAVQSDARHVPAARQRGSAMIEFAVVGPIVQPHEW